ncbi:MAG: hypothetical protein S0880_16125 [Actinomycetota bacterium]|nr:hypothetical protein [Actinomycetota bacterium]
MNDEPESSDEVGIELVGSASAPAHVEGATIDSTDGGRRSGPLVVVGALLVALIGWIALDAVLTDHGDETATPTTTTPVDPAPTTTTTRPPTTTTTADAAATAPFPALRLLPDAPAIDVPLAVVPTQLTIDPSDPMPVPESSSVWFLDDGRALSRDDLPPLGPMFGRGSAFTAGVFIAPGNDGVVRVDGATGARSVSPLPGGGEHRPNRVFNGASDGEAWLEVLDLSEQTDGLVPTSLIRLSARGEELFGAQSRLDGTSALASAIADGLLVYPESGTGLSYWSPERGSAPLESLSDGSWALLGVQGDLAAFWTDARSGRRFRIVDARADRIVAEIADPPGTAENAFDGCFGPDRRHLAVRHLDLEASNPAGRDDDLVVLWAYEPRVSVLDLARPDEPATEIDLGAPVTDLAWISPTGLIAATPEQLVLVDVATSEQTAIAELAGAEAWLVHADGPGC